LRQLIFLFLVLLSATPSFAFKWSQCKGLYKQKDKQITGKGNFGQELLGITSQTTSESTSDAFGSTTSYISSTGKCAAFAKAEEQRIRYVAETMVELQMELAEGQGEHVSSLATLYGCNNKAKLRFNDVMKANHPKIFMGGSDQHPVDVMQRMTETLVNTDILQSNCDLEQI
jgi:hypothetical protein